MSERRRKIQHTSDLLKVMGRLMVLWSVFLFLFELMDWFGVTRSSLRVLDELAMVATLALFLVSTLGVRAAVQFLERRRQRQEVSRC